MFSTIQAATHEEESPADNDDKFDQILSRIELEWGIRPGDIEIAGANPTLINYESTVKLVDRLLPLDITAESTNEQSEQTAGADVSDYGQDSEYLMPAGSGPSALVTVHEDLLGSRKRRLGELATVRREMNELLHEKIQHRNPSLEDVNEEDRLRLSRLLEILYYAENVQAGLRHLMHLLSSGIGPMRNIAGALEPPVIFERRFRAQLEEKKPPQMQLALSMLRQLSVFGYRRYRDSVMKPVMIHGRYTYSWTRLCGIEEFVWDNINSHLHAENFEWAMNGKSNIQFCVEFLKKCGQHEFPELIKERRIHAFRNAVYITAIMDESGEFQRQSHVIYFNEPHAPPETDSVLMRMTASGAVAACFHDCDFPPRRGTDGKPEAHAPTFERISTHQRWIEDVKEWFRAACGRMLHPIGSTPSPKTLEKWQIFWLFLGVGNSGKSTTIDNIVYNFFDSEDIVYIQNNLEKQYGWSKCKGRYMWLAPEIKGDFADHCDQAQFQQVVEGGRLASAKKYAVETTEFDPFDLPGMMGANETIEFHDNGESVSRRRVDFYFGTPVQRVDPDMPEKLKKELGSIIYICNEAYIRKTIEVKGRIWDSLPDYFLELRKENAAATNALEHFLQHGRLEYHPTYYITQTEFQRRFVDHCKENDLHNRKSLKKDYYQGPFFKRQITVEVSTKFSPTEREMKKRQWVCGVRLMTSEGFD